MLGPATYDKRLVYYEDGTVVPDVQANLPRSGSWGGPLPPELQIKPLTWIPRVRFETVLVLKGDPESVFTYTNLGPDYPTLGTSATAEPTRTPSGLGTSSQDPTGGLFLLCLSKKSAHGLFAGIGPGERQMFIKPNSGDEYIASLIPSVALPKGRYVLEGTTPRQRYASVIVQAWQRHPSQPTTVLNFVSWDITTVTTDADGNKVPTDRSFAKFAEDKLVPRLNSLKTGRLLNRIRVNYWSWRLTVNTDKYFPEFQRMIQELDRTWPDPNAPPSDMYQRFDRLYGPESFIRSLVSARTVFIRVKAVETLAVDHANLRLIVDRLRVEPSFHVQLQCCTWLRLLGHKEYPRYADAPNETRARNTITNLQAIIDYWSVKIPQPINKFDTVASPVH